MSKVTPLSEMDLDGFEERELSDRSNVSADIAAVIASGEGCAIEWNSAQLAQAKRLIQPEGMDEDGKEVKAGEYFGKVTLSQLGNKSASVRQYKNGNEVTVERYKRELIAVRPI